MKQIIFLMGMILCYLQGQAVQEMQKSKTLWHIYKESKKPDAVPYALYALIAPQLRTTSEPVISAAQRGAHYEVNSYAEFYIIKSLYNLQKRLIGNSPNINGDYLISEIFQERHISILLCAYLRSVTFPFLGKKWHYIPLDDGTNTADRVEAIIRNNMNASLNEVITAIDVHNLANRVSQLTEKLGGYHHSCCECQPTIQAGILVRCDFKNKSNAQVYCQLQEKDKKSFLQNLPDDAVNIIGYCSVPGAIETFQDDINNIMSDIESRYKALSK